MKLFQMKKTKVLVFSIIVQKSGYETVSFTSCATLGYAIDQWKLIYSYADFQVDSPYNTYRYKGLPIGPGGMPGEPSIKAAIYPEKHDYYYFMANVCDLENKVSIFAKTNAEHERNKSRYLCK